MFPRSMPTSPTQLRQHILRRKRSIALSALATATWVGISIGLTFLLRIIVDRYGEGWFEGRTLALYLAAYFGFTLVSALGSFYMRRFPLAIGQQVAADVRDSIFANLMRLDRSFYRQQRTGDIMNRLNSDVYAVGEMVSQVFLNGVRGTLVFGILFPVMFWLDTELGWILLGLVSVMIFTGFALVKMLRNPYEKIQEQFSDISNFCQENFNGIRMVKGFGIEDRQQEGFEALNREYVRRNLHLARLESPMWPFLDILFLIGNVLIVWFGGRQVIHGDLSLGTLVQFQQFLLFMQWPILGLGWTLGHVLKGRASWRRLLELLDARGRIADGGTRVGAEEVKGDIEFRHVSLTLGGVKVLDDVNLTLPAGRVIGLTGPTGCGKSLLMSLLVRETDPDEGQVRIGARDLRDLPLESLREAVRMAPQDPFLFSDTLFENIAFGHETPDAPAPRVEWASGIARLTGEVENFSAGFQTLLGERGVTLSGGQRQRTSIARAVVGTPQVLVLDDTLSAVDTQTEAEILKRLLPYMRERTSILISHRVSTLRHADLIVVMDQGRLVQKGSHEELLAQPGYYRELDIRQRLQAELEAM